jgi:hypothetical protein
VCHVSLPSSFRSRRGHIHLLRVLPLVGCQSKTPTACTESGPLSHPPSPMAPVRRRPEPFPPPPYAIALTWCEEEHDLARGRGVGGIHAGRSADFARGESSPKVASRQAQMASRIARMDFDEAVGRASWCFFSIF